MKQTLYLLAATTIISSMAYAMDTKEENPDKNLKTTVASSTTSKHEHEGMACECRFEKKPTKTDAEKKAEEKARMYQHAVGVGL